MQQRGIRAKALEALLDFGRTAHVDRGREIVFFDKAARARMARQGPAVAKEAERLLADTGWLPEPLRLVAEVEASTPDTEVDGEDDGAALPDFLAGEDEESAGEDEDHHLVAAE